MKFIYCPDCGKKLVEKEIGDEGMIPYCEGCAKPWFPMFSTCVIVLVANEENEIALLQQNYLSDRYRNLVSGYMKPGECAEETAQREVLEEIGVKVRTLEPTGTYWFEKKDMLMIGFIAGAGKCPLTLSGEVDLADWVPAGEALMKVHPKGSISYALVEEYLKRLDSKGGKQGGCFQQKIIVRNENGS